MNLLALDTSASACSVVLQYKGRTETLYEIAPLQQARTILPMIQQLLASCSCQLSALDAIAFACGPGSFTGTRIGSSVAQGLGFALNKPIIKVSSLAILAQTVVLAAPHPPHYTHVMVAVDARMGRVYWASYAVGKEGDVELVSKEQTWEAKHKLCLGIHTHIQDAESPLSYCGVGDGWEKYEKELLEQLGSAPIALYPAQAPSANALLRLAIAKFKSGECATAREAVPVYL